MTLNNYEKLFALSKEIRLFESISFLLEWDQETHMPKEGSSLRAQQLSLVASEMHQRRTSSELLYLVDTLKNDESLTQEQKANVREWDRDTQIAIKIPNDFVKEFALLTSEAMTQWAEARKHNTFKTFAPLLEKVVAFSREKAALLGPKAHPYDALLDTFEPHMTTQKIETLFGSLKQQITSLLQQIMQKKQVDDSAIHGTFSASKQMDFGRMLLKEMGYDLRKGRLDLSAHPFSMSMHPSDSRVTTRVHPTSLFDCISAVMHEGGHSLYEMGLTPEYYGSPLCEAVSLGIHESQSRLWETRIGQSKSFWHHFLPSLKKTFPSLKPLTLEDFYRAINKVSPTFIRVEADEVTYSLHVILRFEIEKALIEGSLAVCDLPDAWNQKMQDLLDIIPPTDTLGCLQDIHWSMGAFGYFPTYTLGNLYASQFFAAFEKDYPTWEEQLASGELLFIKKWLNEKIHQHGRFFTAEQLVKNITGHELTTTPYLSYLTQKYQHIYS